jgi:cytochrome c-type biogenesis protein
MQTINLPIAFAAGAISFFAPCVIPLLPAYISYVTGVSVGDLQKKGLKQFQLKLLSSSLLYILGFSVVFVAMGTLAAGIGSTLRSHTALIQQFGGAVILLLGLTFAGVINLPILSQTKQMALPAWAGRLGNFRSFVVGVIFATAWTPCVGAILGSILALAAVSETALSGSLLLFVYSLGISLPFLLVSFTLAQAPKYLKLASKYAGTISKVAGILLAALGLLLLTDTYKYLSSWLYSLFLSISIHL